ncbi:MAG: SH3 domain-containing protein [Umezawaea sp.]
MRIFKAAAAVALAATGLLAGSSTALAAPADQVSAKSALFTVTAWHDVNARTCPSTSCEKVDSLVAGQVRKIACWVHGESVTDFGVTNDIWLQVNRTEGNVQWSSAIYFVGDQYANTPADADCTKVPA